MQVEMQVNGIHFELPAAIEEGATAAAIGQVLIAPADIHVG
jgi:hydroxymethylglutaryl-CoA reductase